MIFAISTPAQDPNFGNQELPQGAEALTRGPVHEGFAAPVVYNPTAGVIAVKSPPAPIEELPPDQKPEGDIVWIPGYWSWDEERQDYIWISGIWRDPPPGMTWVPGYWIEVDGGFQWTSGYWQQIDTEEVEYLPEPPQSLENGPNIPQPDDNHFWIPGTYVWHEARYHWQPGYWTSFQPGWVWVPARYHWTPTGYLYTAGYWDVPMETRGVMFAPVYFTAARPVNYYYTPSIVLNVGAITTHLFCRPHHHAYVFGDFYEDRYVRSGYTPWFEFGRTRYGYDPNFVYYRHHFRQSNPDWAVTLRRNHDFIRRDSSYRPPRTFREQTNIVQNITNVNTTVTNTMVNNVSVNNISNNTVGRIGSVNMATPLNRAVQQNAFNNFKVSKIDDNNRRRIQTVAQQTREVSQERRQVERAQLQRLQASGAATKTKTGAVQIKQPIKVKLDQKTVTNLNAGASKIRTDAGRKTDVARPGTAGDREVGKGGGRPGDTGRPGDRPGVVGRPGDRPGVTDRPGDKPGAAGRPGDRPAVTGRPGDSRPGMQDKPGAGTGTPSGDRPGVTGRPVRPGERPSGIVKQPEGRPGERPSGAVKQPEGRPGVDPRTSQTPPGQRPGVGAPGATGGQMKTPQPRDLPPGRVPGSQGQGQGNAGKGNVVPGAGGSGQPIRRPPPQPEKEKEKQKGKTAADLNEDARRAAMRGQANPQGGDTGRRGYPQGQGQGGGDAARQAQAAQQQAAQQQAAQQKAAQMKASQDSQAKARAAQDQQARAKAAQDAQSRAKAAQDQQSRAKAAQDAQQRAKSGQDQQAAEARAKAARDAQQRQQQQQQERMKQAQKQQGDQQPPGNRPNRNKEEDEKEKRGKGR